MAKMEADSPVRYRRCVFVAASTVIKFPAMLGLKIKGQNYTLFSYGIAASNGTATNNYTS
jgi:hypothetical protein